MFNDKVAKAVQELLVDKGFPLYYIDMIPSYDLVKNPNGFVGWDIEQLISMHSTEGIEYGNIGLILNFELVLTVYDGRMSTRNSIETKILDVLCPIVSGKRKPIVGLELTNAFIRNIVWTSTSEFPIPKSAQSNAEMSASVMLFNSSISVRE